MLHVFNRRKSGLYKRYLGHRDDSEGKVSEEDEITALLMGPLDYMHIDDVTSFWRHVITHNTTPKLLPLQIPTTSAEQAEMHFWPSRENIEPDLLIKLRWPQGPTITLLVEFKWRAPLSGERQLHLQWEAFLSQEERDHAYHLFIAPDISAGLNAQVQEDIWGGHLLLRSWPSILEVLSHIPNNCSVGFHKWKEHVTSMLERLQIRKFHGFSKLLPLPPEVHDTPVFWNSWSGFAGLMPPEIQIFYPKCSGTELMDFSIFFHHPFPNPPATQSTFLEYNPMNTSYEIGKAITENFEFVSKVGGECEGLTKAIKDALHIMLRDMSTSNQYKAQGGWYSSDAQSDDRWVSISASYSMEIARKHRQEGRKKYLCFQISLAGDGIKAKDNREPLIHVALWKSSFVLKGNNICCMKFPYDAEEGKEIIVISDCLLQIQHTGETDDHEWLYSLRLTDINSQQDIQKNIVEPVEALLLGKSAAEVFAGTKAVRYQAVEDEPGQLRALPR